MYTFDKADCKEPFAGMIHGLAIYGALVGLRPLTMLPTVDAGERIPSKTFYMENPKPAMLLTIVADDHVLATVSEENAPEVFRAFRDWQNAERASSSEGHAWNRAIAAADEYLGENNFDELADSIEIAD